MTHVVTGRCVACKYTDCCTVCPVDCFYEVSDPAMLVIDPDTCIDCEACIPACPIHAIYPLDELPAPYAEWTAKNADLVKAGTMLNSRKDPLPGAKSLEEIQSEEKAKGWEVPEPHAA